MGEPREGGEGQGVHGEQLVVLERYEETKSRGGVFSAQGEEIARRGAPGESAGLFEGYASEEEARTRDRVGGGGLAARRDEEEARGLQQLERRSSGGSEEGAEMRGVAPSGSSSAGGGGEAGEEMREIISMEGYAKRDEETTSRGGISGEGGLAAIAHGEARGRRRGVGGDGLAGLGVGEEEGPSGLVMGGSGRGVGVDEEMKREGGNLLSEQQREVPHVVLGEAGQRGALLELKGAGPHDESIGVGGVAVAGGARPDYVKSSEEGAPGVKEDGERGAAGRSGLDHKSHVSEVIVGARSIIPWWREEDVQ